MSVRQERDWVLAWERVWLGAWVRKRPLTLYATASDMCISSGLWSISCSIAASAASYLARIAVACDSFAAWATSADIWALSGRLASTMSSA